MVKYIYNNITNRNIDFLIQNYYYSYKNFFNKVFNFYFKFKLA